VIEIPRGSRNKYEWDGEREVIRLDRRIPGAVSYPTDYGFVVDTLEVDGDPLDALVMIAEPTYPGIWITARPVCVGWVVDEGGREAKVLCVPAGDPSTESLRDLDDVPGSVLTEIEQFFDVYKVLEPQRHARMDRWGNRAAAWRAIREARARRRRCDERATSS
jgi:inorganic pyrophosphatase